MTVRCLLGAALLALAGAASAQTFPAKPLRIVVGYPPGGAVDANARVLAPKMAEALGQPVLVENKPGAAGQIATDYVAKSAPDGHIVLLTTVGHAIAPALYRKLPYDPVTDLVAVTQTTAASMLLVVAPSVPTGNLKEFIALAAAKPGVLNYGSPGTADPLGFAMELFKFAAGVNVTAVTYKGVGPAFTALLAGEVDVAFMPTAQTIPHLKSGKLRALATGHPQRIAALPEVPTAAEAGLPGFEATNWQGLFAPGRTPPDIVRQIRDAVAKALASPEVRERLLSGGLEIVASSPDAFDAKVRADMAKFARVVREARIAPLD